jgi:hypothetical protein
LLEHFKVGWIGHLRQLAILSQLDRSGNGAAATSANNRSERPAQCRDA